jgi:hypothetical protein
MNEEIKPIVPTPADEEFVATRDLIVRTAMTELLYAFLGVPECVLYGCEPGKAGQCKHCWQPMPKPTRGALIGASPMSAAYPRTSPRKPRWKLAKRG